MRWRNFTTRSSPANAGESVVRPKRFLDEPHAAEIRAGFSELRADEGVSYATIRDYCDSVDFLPKITKVDGDLKNVQRPWAVKTLLWLLPPPARCLEIGGAEPSVRGALSELGYDVTLVDPYDGCGNGPTEFERYAALFPHVNIVRAYLSPSMPQFRPSSFDAVFSVSVIEYLPAGGALDVCFRATAELLRPGGASLHCFDFVLQGIGHDYDFGNASKILAHQAALMQRAADPAELSPILTQLSADVETFYLSPRGHHRRNGLAYDHFPFRKVVSLQSYATRAA